MENNQKTDNSQFLNQGGKSENEKARERKIIIHSMPKRFLRTRLVPTGTRGVGMAILIFGALLLFAFLAAAYFFVLKPKTEADLFIDDYLFEESAIEQAAVNKNESLPPEDNVLPTESVMPEESNDPVLETETDLNYAATGTDSEIREIIIGVEEGAGTSSLVGENTVDDIEYIPALDSDGDGLSDLEEMLLDTNLRSVDSDGDGYSDLDELRNLYNPAGAGKIIVNPNIEKYTNNTYAYSLYYPLIWLRTNVDGDESILFQAGNNQYVQIIVQANPEKLTLSEWYKSQLNVSVVDSSQIMYKPGWEGIKSRDGVIVYLSKPSGDYVYIISYNTGLDRVLRFKNIFDMMVNSFELID